MWLLHQLGRQEVRLEDVPMPIPADGEVLVRTAISAICGSELPAYRDGRERGNNGHEAAGVVAALGPGVDGFSLGDRVGASAVSGCGTCPNCRRGEFTWCDNWKITDNMHAEYFTIPAMSLTRLPDDIDWPTAVLISGDGIGVPYHSSKRFTVRENGTAVVFGLGPVGLGAVLMQSALGRRVIGVDPSPFRTAYAKTLGASDVVLVADGVDVPASIRALIGGDPDVCIEASGNAGAIRQAFGLVRKGGTVVFNGEHHHPVLSPSEDFIRKDVAAVGTWYFHLGEFGEMLALERNGMAAARLLSDLVPFTDAQSAFQRFASGQTAKIALTWSAF